MLVQFDELSALEKLSSDDFENELLKIEEKIKNRLDGFSQDYWSAKWLNEVS